RGDWKSKNAGERGNGYGKAYGCTVDRQLRVQIRKKCADTDRLDEDVSCNARLQSVEDVLACSPDGTMETAVQGLLVCDVGELSERSARLITDLDRYRNAPGLGLEGAGSHTQDVGVARLVPHRRRRQPV